MSGSIDRAPEAEATALSAAEILTRDAFTQEWAALQCGRSHLLASVCEQTGQLEAGEEAVRIIREVLELPWREEAPQLWWDWQHLLSHALYACALCGSGAEYLEESLCAMRAAAEVAPDQNSFQWLVIQEGIAEVLRVLGRRTAGTGVLEQAIACGREVVDRFKQNERYETYWIPTQRRLGASLASYGERLGRQGDAAEGVELCRAALSACERTKHAKQPAECRRDLGEALAALAHCSGLVGHLNEALAQYRLAREGMVPGGALRELRWIDPQIHLIEADSARIEST